MSRKKSDIGFGPSSVGAFLQRFRWIHCPAVNPNSQRAEHYWRRPDSTVTVSTGEAWDQTMRALAEARDWRLVILAWIDGAPHFLGGER